ncbi:ankyrin repeat domain-containing protein, partial [archaeon]
EECVRMLLDAGASIEGMDKDGWTPLFTTCMNGHNNCTGALLAAGANMHALTKDGDTPLSIVIRRDRAADWYLAYVDPLDRARELLNASAHTDPSMHPLLVRSFSFSAWF